MTTNQDPQEVRCSMILPVILSGVLPAVLAYTGHGWMALCLAFGLLQGWLLGVLTDRNAVNRWLDPEWRPNA